jgi:nicotinamide riboside kinase
MKSKVLAFCGKKGSGKNTLANFLTGYQLRANEIIKDFSLDDKGRLFALYDANGKDAEGLLDLNRNDFDFGVYASQSIWPFVKTYAFANPLKDICHELFEIPRELLHGTDEDKNTVMEHLRWENMPGVITRRPIDIAWSLTEGYMEQKYTVDMITAHFGEFYKNIPEFTYHDSGLMTVREFLQFMGTEVMRKIYGPVWVNLLKRQIQSERSDLSIITDCRFDNEIDGLKSLPSESYDVKFVYLTRYINADDKHVSENGTNLQYADLVLDNMNMSLTDTCIALQKQISDWGWLE